MTKVRSKKQPKVFIVTFENGEPQYQGYLLSQTLRDYTLQCFSWLTGNENGDPITVSKSVPHMAFPNNEEMLAYMDRWDEWYCRTARGHRDPDKLSTPVAHDERATVA